MPSFYLYAINAIEYLFKVGGYFLVTALLSGLIIASCTKSAIGILPIALIISLILYIALTSICQPVFILISKMQPGTTRKLTGLGAVLLVLAVTTFSALPGVILDLSMLHVKRFFPGVNECESGFFSIEIEDFEPPADADENSATPVTRDSVE